jgi:DNA-directed RNA polymerase specialized sigma24 family protein
VCLAGHRRLKASRKAGLTDVPVVVRSDLNTRALQVAAMVAENMHRADLTPIEEASAYQLLLDEVGLTVKEIAAGTGRPAATVKSRLKLTRLPGDVQARVQDRQITLADADALADLAEQDPAAAERAATAGDLRWAIQSELQTVARRERFTKLVDLVDGQSVVRVVRRADLPEEWRSWGAGSTPRQMGYNDVAHQWAPLWEAKGKTPASVSTGCPNMCVLVDDNDLTVNDGYCLDPNSHYTGATAGTSPAAGDDEWRAGQAERQRLSAEHAQAQAVAASLRQQWLAEVVAGGGIADTHLPAAVALLTRLTLSPAQELVQLWADACAWLRDLPGFPKADPDYVEDDWTPVLTALARLTPATAALVTAAALLEDTSQRPSLNYGAGEDWQAYTAVLVAAGYRLSEWEATQLQRAAGLDDSALDVVPLDDSDEVEDLHEDRPVHDVVDDLADYTAGGRDD